LSTGSGKVAGPELKLITRDMLFYFQKRC